MKAKKLLTLLAVVAVTAIPFSVYAATSDAPAAKSIRGFFGIDASKLTDKQKADVTDYSKKMADLQKEFIDKMVGNGSMTKEQGEAAKGKIDEMEKDGQLPGLIGGKGVVKGHFEKRDGFGIGGIDPAKLTDQQKADLTAIHKKMIDSQKEFINKQVSNGIITKVEGDSTLAKIDEMQKGMEDKGFFPGLMIGKGGPGGFGFFGMHGVDTSKLTAAQKAVFTDFSKKMAELQKESINKMVSNGLLTKAQGESAIEKMEDMKKFQQDHGFQNGKEKMKGRFGGFKMRGAPEVSSTNAAV
jgi:hypothetical protein